MPLLLLNKKSCLGYDTILFLCIELFIVGLGLEHRVSCVLWKKIKKEKNLAKSKFKSSLYLKTSK